MTNKTFNVWIRLHHFEWRRGIHHIMDVEAPKSASMHVCTTTQILTCRDRQTKENNTKLSWTWPLSQLSHMWCAWQTAGTKHPKTMSMLDGDNLGKFSFILRESKMMTLWRALQLCDPAKTVYHLTWNVPSIWLASYINIPRPTSGRRMGFYKQKLNKINGTEPLKPDPHGQREYPLPCRHRFSLFLSFIFPCHYAEC